MSTEKRAKLRILCIHGYRQSSKTFREKTGSLRKILKSRAELIYITAPNSISNSEDEFGWWFSSKDCSYKAQDYTDCCPGFDESIETVANAFTELGPFDGVIAFSQGASLLSVICGMKEMGDERFTFKFSIFVAGFHSRQSAHKKYYDKAITVPSFHVIGDTDQVIEREMSDKLLESFTDASVLRHQGGHFIPTTSAVKKDYFNFLDKFL